MLHAGRQALSSPQDGFHDHAVFCILDQPAGVRSAASTCAATLQEMNPLVSVLALQQPEGDPFPEALLGRFNVVVLVDARLDQIQQADEACRRCSTAFYAASARGTCSFMFADLCNHFWTPQVHISAIFACGYLCGFTDMPACQGPEDNH